MENQMEQAKVETNGVLSADDDASQPKDSVDNKMVVNKSEVVSPIDLAGDAQSNQIDGKPDTAVEKVPSDGTNEVTASENNVNTFQTSCEVSKVQNNEAEQVKEEVTKSEAQNASVRSQDVNDRTRESDELTDKTDAAATNNSVEEKSSTTSAPAASSPPTTTSAKTTSASASPATGTITSSPNKLSNSQCSASQQSPSKSATTKSPSPAAQSPPAPAQCPDPTQCQAQPQPAESQSPAVAHKRSPVQSTANQSAGVNPNLVRATKSLPTPVNSDNSTDKPTDATAVTSDDTTSTPAQESSAPVEVKEKKRKKEKRAKHKDEAGDARERASKRIRLQYQPFQSPESLPKMFRPSAFVTQPRDKIREEDKVVVFNRNEFLAVRNETNTFFVCRTAQNVYKNSRKFKIQWFNNEKHANIYKADYYDHTDFECVLTNLRLTRLEKGEFELPDEERQRTMNILQRAINIEKGIDDPIDPTKVAVDGVDVSVVGKAEEKELIKQIKKDSKKSKVSETEASPSKSDKSDKKPKEGAKRESREKSRAKVEQKVEKKMKQKKKKKEKGKSKKKAKLSNGMASTSQGVKQQAVTAKKSPVKTPPKKLVAAKKSKAKPSPSTPPASKKKKNLKAGKSKSR